MRYLHCLHLSDKHFSLQKRSTHVQEQLQMEYTLILRATGLSHIMSATFPRRPGSRPGASSGLALHSSKTVKRASLEPFWGHRGCTRFTNDRRNTSEFIDFRFPHKPKTLSRFQISSQKLSFNLKCFSAQITMRNALQLRLAQRSSPASNSLRTASFHTYFLQTDPVLWHRLASHGLS